MNQEQEQQYHYSGNVFGRLFAYLKPYTRQMITALVLILAVTALDLFRPTLIGNAIDQYIEKYNTPYGVVEKSDIYYDGQYLKKGDTTASSYNQLVAYDDNYYYFKGLDHAKSQELYDLTLGQVKVESQSEDQIVVNGLTGVKLDKTALKTLRNSDLSGLKQIALLYVVVLVFTAVFTFVETWILQLTGQSIIYTIREQLFHHIHHLPLRYHDTHPVGSTVTRVTNDVESLHEMYANILVRLFRNVVKIVGLMIVMMRIHLKLSFFAFCLVPVIVALTIYFRKMSRQVHREIRTKISSLNTFLSENISGMKIIQIFTNEKIKYQEFEGKSNALYKATMKQIMIFSIFRPLTYLIAEVALAFVLYQGSKGVLDGALSIGTLYVFSNYIANFYDPVQELAEQFTTLQNALASAEKIFTVLDEENPIKEPEKPVALENIKGKIEFKHVWFAYEKEDYVLKDVSFVIEPGQKVAFVGATGAGKSSILNLVGRYYDIQKGQILIDDVDIRELSTSQIRDAIGQVQQDVFIFTGDIESNITLNNKNISHEKVVESAKTVNASHFIEQLPHQYQEPVSERGSTLSAGQRQLLSFARTLAFDPKILVMDEATANIDTETEQLIQQALERLMQGRTTIMVAHRLSTIQHADNIIVMHHGLIRESGTHQELLNQNGIYKKLYDLQLYSQN